MISLHKHITYKKDIFMNNFKHIKSLLILIQVCFFSHLLCMEQNQHTGPIDKAVLSLEINNKGHRAVQMRIMQQRMEDKYGDHRMPFIITHHLSNDNSDTAQSVFSAVNNNTV